MDKHLEELEKYRYLESKAERNYQLSEKYKEEIKKLKDEIPELKKIKKDIKEIKRDIEKTSFKHIEILTIFVAIIGFLFGFIKFSTMPQFSFIEVSGLLIILALVLICFIFLMHSLFNR